MFNRSNPHLGSPPPGRDYFIEPGLEPEEVIITRQNRLGEFFSGIGELLEILKSRGRKDMVPLREGKRIAGSNSKHERDNA